MSACQTAHLTSRSVLCAEGPEASEFLQGLITNDMSRVTRDTSIYAALLTPQGKILFEFHVVQIGDAQFLLDVAAHSAEALLKRLTMYKLRAAVTLAHRPDLHVLAHFPSNADISRLPGAVAMYTDSRNPSLGSRTITETIEGATASEDDYHAHRRSLGVPEGAEVGDSSTFLLEANFEELNGVDFKKGCYVGQELAARMKHKTTLRKRLLPFSIREPLSDAATSITAGESEIGQVIDLNETGGFALIRLDRLDAAGGRGEASTLGGTSVEIIVPDWLQLSLQKASDA